MTDSSDKLELTGEERIYITGLKVLYEQLNKLRGEINPAANQPTLHTIDVVGRLTLSIYPVVESMREEKAKTQVSGIETTEVNKQ